MGSSRKKTPEKAEQGQQTSPMVATPSMGLTRSRHKTPTSGSSMVDVFKRMSPKQLTPDLEQEASLAGRFRAAARNVARGAAMLGLADPPDDPRAKRKLLKSDTPSGPA